MRIDEIIERLDEIAKSDGYDLYIKGKDNNRFRVLKCVFFNPISGKSKYLMIELDKFCDEDLLHINMLLKGIDRQYGAYPSKRYANSESIPVFHHIYGKRINKPSIEKVIFNDPATIIFWTDGTKTVVKAQDGEVFDPEKGMAMAISKKFLGNEYEYYDEFKKWVGRYEKQQRKKNDAVKAFKNLGESLRKLGK